MFALVVEETCNRSWLPRVLELIDLGVAEVLAVVHIIFGALRVANALVTRRAM